MDRIRIHEVGPRDGLQAESAVVPADVRMHWIQSIIRFGIDSSITMTAGRLSAIHTLCHISLSLVSKPEDVNLAPPILAASHNQILYFNVGRRILGKQGNMVIIDHYLRRQDEITRLVTHLLEEH